eukprot:403350432
MEKSFDIFEFISKKYKQNEDFQKSVINDLNVNNITNLDQLESFEEKQKQNPDNLTNTDLTFQILIKDIYLERKKDENESDQIKKLQNHQIPHESIEPQEISEFQKSADSDKVLIDTSLNNQGLNDDLDLVEMEENKDVGINSNKDLSINSNPMINNFTGQKSINKQSESQNPKQTIINQNNNNNNYKNDQNQQNNKDGGEPIEVAEAETSETINYAATEINDQSHNKQKNNHEEDNTDQFDSCNSSFEDLKVNDHEEEHKVNLQNSVQIDTSTVPKVSNQEPKSNQAKLANLKEDEDLNSQFFKDKTSEEYHKTALNISIAQQPVLGLDNPMKNDLDKIINTKDIEKIEEHLIKDKNEKYTDYFLNYLKQKQFNIYEEFLDFTSIFDDDKVFEKKQKDLETKAKFKQKKLPEQAFKDIDEDSKELLLVLLEDLSIDELIQEAFELLNKNKLAGRKVLRILSTLSYLTYQKLYQKERMKLFLNEFQVIAKSSDLIKQQVEQFLKNIVLSEAELKTHKIKKLKNNEMTELLIQINNQDETTTDLILRSFKDDIVKRNIKIPRSRQQIQNDSIAELRKILKFPRTKKTIVNFYSVDYNFDPDFEQDKLIKDFQRTNIIDHENLIRILFHYVKSRLDPELLIHKFVNVRQNFNLTRSRLIQYLLKISDQDLRIQLVISLSQYLPLPLLSVDWQLNEKEVKYEIINELFYVFEKQMSILNFGVLNDQKQLPPNIEKFVNQILSKVFESDSECCLNDGTLEIQFDYNFENPQYLPVATYHGPMTYEKLSQIQNLFDIFIIQQNSDEEQTPEQILKSNQFIEQINSFKKGLCLIIVIDCSSQYQYFKTSELSQNIMLVQSEFLETTKNKSLIVNLIQAIHQRIRSYRKNELNDYLATPNLRMNSHFMYYEFIKEMGKEDLTIKSALDNTRIIVDQIFYNKHNLHSEQFLPMSYLYKEYCQLEYEIQRDIELDSESKTQFIEKKKNIEKAMQTQNPSPIIIRTNQIIKNNQILGCLTITSKIIKNFMKANMKPLYDARQVKRAEQQTVEKMMQADKTDKTLADKNQQILDDITEITKDIEAKTFSIEFIIRELYLLSQYNSEKGFNKNKENFVDFTRNQVKFSQPFEVIDGNNLQFVNGVFDDLFSEDVDIFVISIIGPQSSGKSLLLNFLFGTQFQSSEGRCTKGVYGSIMEIYNNKTKRKMKIIILDTEGILSTEGRDGNFDRRIVFYILCVSHVVLICNKGEMNRTMSEIIQLAASTIQTLNTTYIKPKIYIIMNMLRKADDQVLIESIQGLSTEISTIDSSNNTSNLFNISEKSVVVLPFAFNTQGSDEFSVNNPSPVFAQQLQPLKSKIIENLKEYEANNNFKYTQNDWFNYANEFWQRTYQFRGFMEYKTLAQKKLEKGLIHKQKELINQFFLACEKQNLERVQADVQEQLKAQSGESILKAQHILRNVIDKVEEFYSEICSNIKKEYDNYCQSSSVGIEIKDKNWQQLLRNTSSFKQSWINDSKQKTHKFIDEKQRLIGNETLNKHLSHLQKQNSQYDLNEANKLFKDIWDKVLQITISQQRTIQEIRKYNIENYKSVYQQETDKTQLIQNNEIKELLEKYEQSNNKIFIKELEKEGNHFLYHIKGQAIHPKIIVDSQNQVKTYLKMKPLVNQQCLYTTFKIFEVLRKIVAVDQLADKMCQNMFYNSAILFGKKYEREVNYSYYMKETYHQFNVELSKFNIRMKNTFESELEYFDDILTGLFKNEDHQIEKEKDSEKQSVKIYEKYRKAIGVYINKTISSYKEYYEFSNQKLDAWGNKPQFIVQKIKIKNNQGKQIEASIDEFLKDFKKNYFVVSQSADEEVIGDGEILVRKTQSFNIIDDSLPPKTQHNARTYVWRYLDYLINTKDSNKSINQVGCEAKAMQLFLFQKIQLEKIVNDIEEIVLDKFKTDESKKFSNIKSAIEWLKQNQNLKSRNLFCKISNKIIQNIACEVNQLKGKIDKELEIYELKINYVGEKVLNLIALVLINALQEQLEMIEEQSALEELKKTEQSQKALFIAKLTSNDEQTDIALATKIIETYNQKLTQIIKTDTIKEYQKYLASNQSEFQIRDKIQNNLIDSALAFKIDQIKILTQINFQFGESQIGSKLNLEEVKSSETNCSDINLKDVIEGFMYPKTFLNRKFTEIWQSVTISKIRLSQKNASLQLLSSLNKIEEYMNDFYKLLETKKCLEPSMNLFTLNQQDDKSTQASQEEINMLKDLTQQCSAIYLQEMLLGTFTSSTNLTINGTSLKPYPGKYLPVSDDLSNTTLDDLFIAVMRETLNDEKISKIQTFISTVIQSITTQKQQEFSIEDFEMNGNYYSEFQTLFIGCTEHCPLCRQQCEKDHSNDPVNQRTHDCSKGHQLQCFGGNKDLNNNASVKTCSELKDDTIVKLNGSSQKWGSLKNEAKFKNWKFTQQSVQQVNIIKNKYSDIWNKFGPLFCEIYKDRHNIQISFVRSDNIQYREIHYLLLLDKSGSMKGQRWEDLKSGVLSFLKDLKSDILKQLHSKVSIILYDNSTTVLHSFAASDVTLINSLSIEPNGGTSFVNLFQKTYEYLTQHLSKADKHVVCVMTDGESAYPESELNQFLQNQELMDKISVSTILYSTTSSPVLQKIATTLKGTMKTALTSQQLEDSFKELIANVYV